MEKDSLQTLCLTEKLNKREWQLNFGMQKPHLKAKKNISPTSVYPFTKPEQWDAEKRTRDGVRTSKYW